jgi:N-acetylglucosamine malate deacetylase 1
MTGKKSVLVVAAHPDDEVLGCGAALAKHAAVGDKVTVLILGEGATSRSEERDTDYHAGALDKLRQCAKKALQKLGGGDLHFGGLPDNRFDTVALLDIVKTIEKLDASNGPFDVVYTHHAGDLNIDHRRSFEAVLTAFRAQPGRKSPDILAFYIPSSTDYALQVFVAFAPNFFVNAKETLPKKLAALKEYDSEMRPYPHPRSYEGVEIAMKYWALHAGMEVCEPFQLVRRTE